MSTFRLSGQTQFALLMALGALFTLACNASAAGWAP